MKRNRYVFPASLLLAAGLSACQPTPVKKQPDAAAQPPATTEEKSVTVDLAADPTSASGAADRVAATSAPAQTPEYPRYDSAKGDFQYGPGQPWPKLVVPPQLTPGPLAAAPGTLPPAQAAPAALPLSAQAEPADTPSPCASALAASSLDLGPKEAWLTQKLKSAAVGLLSKAIFGFGGGGGDDSASDNAPPTVRDPIPKSARQAFHDKLSDIEMTLSGRLNDDGLLLSSGIDDAPDKSTFHAVYIENKRCQRQFPDRYLNYRLWLEWSLSVSWSKTERRYENDSLVSEKTSSGGFFKSGEINLAEGSINLTDASALDEYQQGLLAELPPPIWQQMGFSAPTAGVRGLGSQFNQVNAAELLGGDAIAVIHVTRVVDGRYVTRALPFRMERGTGDLLKFSRL